MKSSTTDNGKANDSGAEAVWRSILLSDEILVRSVHPHVLKKNDPLQQQANNNNDDDSEYESGWLCDGSNKFKGGCKSG